MINDEMRRIFDTVLTSPPPDTTDIDAALRAGHRRRRSRPAAVLGSVAAALVAGVLVITGILATPSTQPPAADGSPQPTTPSAASASPAADAGAPVASASELVGVWQTEQLYGEDITAAPLVARFSYQGQLWWGANDGCNDTWGLLTITSDGGFSAEPGGSTLVACPEENTYPQNPEAVLAADQARIIPAVDDHPRRLLLVSQGSVVSVYTYLAATSAPAADAGAPVASAAELLGRWQTVLLYGEDVTAARDVDGVPLYASFAEDGQLWWGANDGCNTSSGWLTITSDGGFSSGEAVTTARGCDVGTLYPLNPEAVMSAQQARIIPAADGQPRQLLLVGGEGLVLGVYTYQADATPAP